MGIALAAGALVAGAMGCGTSGVAQRPMVLPPARLLAGPDGRAHELAGVASWYGEPYHGRQTACGEIYDMYAFTAAHKTLPFHTVVRVTDTQTMKSVVVRITDRGPFIEGRIIDLSVAAAQDMDMLLAGISPVELEVLQWGDGRRVRP